MKEFLTQALGGQSISQFAVVIFFALLGIFLRLIYHASQRNQISPNTPINFNWLFLLKNNALRLFSSNALSLLLVLITLRFSDDILHVALSPFVSLIIGFGSDTLAEKFKESARQILPYQTAEVIVEAPPATPAKIINQEQPVKYQIQQLSPVIEVTATETNVDPKQA